MKKISKMANFNFFQHGTADVLLLRSKLDMSCSRYSFATSHTVVFSRFKQDIQAKYM